MMSLIVLADGWDDIWQRSTTAIIVFFGTTLLSLFAGRWWGRWQARRAWNQKQFLGRIIVSLNMLSDGWLKIRTIFERSLDDVFLNPVAVDKIRRASLHTTLENPILPIEKEARWYLLNFVLNSVAERFSGALMRHDASQALRPVLYLLFLTCEVVGADRIRKVRVMLVRKDLLEEFPFEKDMPKLEQEWHSDRVITLRVASRLYRTEPDNFLPLEIYV